VQFAEVGTILSVLPRVAEDGNIAMEIAAEDSSAEMVTVTFSDQQSTIPQRLENTTETKVLVHDGETIAIGGLRGASIQDDVERVPFLGELPFVGRLFSSTQKDRTVRELLIFITPRIVDEYTEPEAMRLAELDADAAESFRQSRKSVWERMAEKVNLGEDEIIVAVGERGGIYAEGNVTTVEEFVEGLALVDAPARVTVVIRAHPNAPEEQAAEMTAAAEALGFDVEYDDNIAPFVPNLPPTPAL
jgi:hypothetical protein